MVAVLILCILAFGMNDVWSFHSTGISKNRTDNKHGQLADNAKLLSNFPSHDRKDNIISELHNEPAKTLSSITKIILENPSSLPGGAIETARVSDIIKPNLQMQSNKKIGVPKGYVINSPPDSTRTPQGTTQHDFIKAVDDKLVLDGNTENNTKTFKQVNIGNLRVINRFKGRDHLSQLHLDQNQLLEKYDKFSDFKDSDDQTSESQTSTTKLYTMSSPFYMKTNEITTSPTKRRIYKGRHSSKPTLLNQTKQTLVNHLNKGMLPTGSDDRNSEFRRNSLETVKGNDLSTYEKLSSISPKEFMTQLPTRRAINDYRNGDPPNEYLPNSKNFNNTRDTDLMKTSSKNLNNTRDTDLMKTSSKNLNNTRDTDLMKASSKNLNNTRDTDSMKTSTSMNRQHNSSNGKSMFKRVELTNPFLDKDKPGRKNNAKSRTNSVKISVNNDLREGSEIKMENAISERRKIKSQVQKKRKKYDRSKTEVPNINVLNKGTKTSVQQENIRNKNKPTKITDKSIQSKDKIDKLREHDGNITQRLSNTSKDTLKERNGNALRRRHRSKSKKKKNFQKGGETKRQMLSVDTDSSKIGKKASISNVEKTLAKTKTMQRKKKLKKEHSVDNSLSNNRQKTMENSHDTSKISSINDVKNRELFNENLKREQSKLLPLGILNPHEKAEYKQPKDSSANRLRRKHTREKEYQNQQLQKKKNKREQLNNAQLSKRHQMHTKWKLRNKKKSVHATGIFLIQNDSEKNKKSKDDNKMGKTINSLTTSSKKATKQPSLSKDIPRPEVGFKSAGDPSFELYNAVVQLQIFPNKMKTGDDLIENKTGTIEKAYSSNQNKTGHKSNANKERVIGDVVSRKGNELTTNILNSDIDYSPTTTIVTMPISNRSNEILSEKIHSSSVLLRHSDSLINKKREHRNSLTQHPHDQIRPSMQNGDSIHSDKPVHAEVQNDSTMELQLADQIYNDHPHNDQLNHIHHQLNNQKLKEIQHDQTQHLENVPHDQLKQLHHDQSRGNPEQHQLIENEYSAAVTTFHTQLNESANIILSSSSDVTHLSTPLFDVPKTSETVYVSPVSQPIDLQLSLSLPSLSIMTENSTNSETRNSHRTSPIYYTSDIIKTDGVSTTLTAASEASTNFQTAYVSSILPTSVVSFTRTENYSNTSSSYLGVMTDALYKNTFDLSNSSQISTSSHNYDEYLNESIVVVTDPDTKVSDTATDIVSHRDMVTDNKTTRTSDYNNPWKKLLRTFNSNDTGFEQISKNNNSNEKPQKEVASHIHNVDGHVNLKEAPSFNNSGMDNRLRLSPNFDNIHVNLNTMIHKHPSEIDNRASKTESLDINQTDLKKTLSSSVGNENYGSVMEPLNNNLHSRYKNHGHTIGTENDPNVDVSNHDYTSSPNAINNDTKGEQRNELRLIGENTLDYYSPIDKAEIVNNNVTRNFSRITVPTTKSSADLIVKWNALIKRFRKKNINNSSDIVNFLKSTSEKELGSFDKNVNGLDGQIKHNERVLTPTVEWLGINNENPEKDIHFIPDVPHKTDSSSSGKLHPIHDHSDNFHSPHSSSQHSGIQAKEDCKEDKSYKLALDVLHMILKNMDKIKIAPLRKTPRRRYLLIPLGPETSSNPGHVWTDNQQTVHTPNYHHYNSHSFDQATPYRVFPRHH